MIFCTLGAKQDEKKELFLIINSDSKISAVSPFKHYFLHEASQFVSLDLFLYECKF